MGWAVWGPQWVFDSGAGEKDFSSLESQIDMSWAGRRSHSLYPPTQVAAPATKADSPQETMSSTAPSPGMTRKFAGSSSER